MAENFLGQIAEYDNNNQANFAPTDTTQHATKNSYGKVIHSALLVANPRQNTPAVIMEADCQASEDVALTTNNFNSKANIPLGGGGIQNPINSTIQVLVLENGVEINSGTTQIKILKNGNITINVQGTPVAQLTQSAVNFLVPVNMPAGSQVNAKLIAVVGGTTVGNAATQTINNSGQ